MTRVRLLALVVVLCVGAGAAVALAATPKITAKGVGGVKLGKRHSVLQQAGLVGRLRAGCPLGGPGARSARLRAPLKGTVQLSRTSTRRVKSIQVTGGATARGVGAGSTIAQIKGAFPEAKVDHSTDSVFEITLVKVPKRAGGRIVFGVSTSTGKATVVGVPNLAFCE
jgi:hypothetical protein